MPAIRALRARLPRIRGPRRWSLRSRLAVAVAALTALGLLFANGAGLFLLRSYLVDQVDGQLAQMTSAISSATPDRIRLLRRFTSEFEGSRLSALDIQKFQLFFVGEEGVRGLLPAARSAPVLPSREALEERASRGPFTVPGEHGGSWRVMVGRLPAGSLAVGASSLNEVDRTFGRLLAIDLIVMAVTLAVLGLLARTTVGVGLRPLSRMGDTAGRIAAGDYARRVADCDPHTEPGRLGAAINLMLARLESEISARTASEERMRRFLADASHELRTPLTSIRGFAELARWRGSSEDALARIEAEATRMGILVEDLLLLARLDEQREVEREPVDLLALTAELVGDLHVSHPDRPIGLTGRTEEHGRYDAVVVLGDELRLRQVIRNLLDNAVRHTPPEASISVVVGRDTHGDALVEVIDTGRGIADEDAPHVFDRLYRADPARASEGGSGLGLAIAAAIVQVHGGRLELDRTPGGGATFRVIIPIPNEL